jgi:hypothetical protein
VRFYGAQDVNFDRVEPRTQAARALVSETRIQFRTSTPDTHGERVVLLVPNIPEFVAWNCSPSLKVLDGFCLF